jgi:hypothetical protein
MSIAACPVPLEPDWTEQRVAALQLTVGQCGPGGLIGDAERGCGGDLERVRDAPDVLGRCREQIGIRARRAGDEDALAGVEARPGRVDPRREGRRRAGRSRIPALGQIEVVDRGCLDPDQHLSLARHRVRGLL